MSNLRKLVKHGEKTDGSPEPSKEFGIGPSVLIAAGGLVFVSGVLISILTQGLLIPVLIFAVFVVWAITRKNVPPSNGPANEIETEESEGPKKSDESEEENDSNKE